jgi:chorismate-pyruvate lyase
VNTTSFFADIQTLDATEVWRSEGYLQNAKVDYAGFPPIPFSQLPPILRTLLITDGTVTKVLEAFFWEPIQVNKLTLQTCTAPNAIPSLNIITGDELLLRQVELRGSNSNRVYAHATSIIKLSAIDHRIKHSLIQGEMGVGVLLRELGLETYREILKIYANQTTETSTLCETDLWIHRIYRIAMAGSPFILLRESFPYAIYQEARV